MSSLNPYSNGYMTWVVDNSKLDKPFNPNNLMFGGATVNVIQASSQNDVMINMRISQLLRTIVSDNAEVTVEYLNSIGFSREDAEQIGLCIDGLEQVNVPPTWQDDL